MKKEALALEKADKLAKAKVEKGLKSSIKQVQSAHDLLDKVITNPKFGTLALRQQAVCAQVVEQKGELLALVKGWKEDARLGVKPLNEKEGLKKATEARKVSAIFDSWFKNE